MKIRNLILLCLVTISLSSFGQITIEEQSYNPNTKSRFVPSYYGEIDKKNNKLILAGPRNNSSWIKFINVYNLEDEKHIDLDESIEDVKDLKILSNGNIGIIYSKIDRETKTTIVFFAQVSKRGEIIKRKKILEVKDYRHSFHLRECKERLIIVHFNYDDIGVGIYHFSLSKDELIFSSKSIMKDDDLVPVSLHFNEEKEEFFIVKSNSLQSANSEYSVFNLKLDGSINWKANKNFDVTKNQRSVLDNEGNLVMIAPEWSFENDDDFIFYTFSRVDGKIIKEKSLILAGNQDHIYEIIKRPNNNGYVLFSLDKNGISYFKYQLILNSNFELEKRVHINDMLNFGNHYDTQYLIDDGEQIYLNLNYSWNRECLYITRFNNSNTKPLSNKPPKVWSVLVGVSRYANSSFNLKTPDDHTQKLVRHFEATYYADNLIEPFIDRAAKKEDILKELERVFTSSKVSENDLVFFFFSGHGGIGEDDIKVLCMYDFDIDNEDTYITHNEIMEIINRSPAKHKVIILEACQNYGLSPQDKVNQLIEKQEKFTEQRLAIGKETIMITSCTNGERSMEYGNTGAVFSHFLLKGVYDGEADGYNNNRKDEIITADELYHYIKDNVDKYCKDVQGENRWQTTTIEPSNYKNIPIFYLR